MDSSCLRAQLKCHLLREAFPDDSPEPLSIFLAPSVHFLYLLLSNAWYSINIKLNYVKQLLL